MRDGASVSLIISKKAVGMTQVSQTKEQFEFVFQALKGWQTVQAIALGLELNLFTALRNAEQGLTPDELAQELDLHAPYVRIWCESAYSFGVLEQTEGRYRLVPGLDTVLLDRDHPRYLGAFALGFTTHLHDDFLRYNDAFSNGSIHAFQDHGVDFSAWVARLTHPMQRLVVSRTLPELFGDLLTAGAKVLDVGAGAGQFLFKLAEAYPNGSYVGVEVDPHGAQMGQREVEKRGMKDRVTLLQKPVEELNRPAEFDLATMFEVLHELPEKVRPAVMRATFDALKPGGKLFILDETWPAQPDDLRDPAYKMSVLVQFSELVWGNVVATEDQQTRLLLDAGFTDLRRGDLGGVFTTIIATKPE
jgi:SAM-dependent methyltransferase